MTARAYIKQNGSTICIVLSLLLFFLSLIVNTSYDSADDAAKQVEKRIEKRMAVLDKYIDEALETSHSQWLILEDLPKDMVIYRYVYDTLQSWCNQFTVDNDDISSKLVFQKLTHQKRSLQSPLKSVTENVKFLNFGPKWYLVKSRTDGISCRIIAGLEVQNILLENLQQTSNGTPKWMKLSGQFSVAPLDYSGGAPVYFEGIPLFKIVSEIEQDSPFLANSVMRWFALIFMSIASMLYLWNHRKIKIFISSVALILLTTIVGYMWGLQSTETSGFFSPILYADGPLLYSFGAVMIMNLGVTMTIFCIYTIKNTIVARIQKHKRSKALLYAYGAALVILFSAVAVYIFGTLNSLILNSDISLELHILSRFSLYSLLIYLSYISLMFCLLLIAQMFSPVIYLLFHKSYRLFTPKVLLVFTIITSAFMTLEFSITGFRKEQNKLIVASYSLAINRDIELELQLRGTEDAIANDRLIAGMAHNPNSTMIILNRLTENYFNKVSQNYDILITIYPAINSVSAKYDRRFLTGSPIADDSRFVYLYDANGQSSYLGQFVYYSPDVGLSRVVIDIQPKGNKGIKGYDSIFGKYAQSPDIALPNFYSYVKYVGGKMVSYKGNYAYPTVLLRPLPVNPEKEISIFRTKNYVHFVNVISEDEAIVISRKAHGIMSYIITFSYLVFITYGFIYLSGKRRRNREKVFRHNYYRSRINAVIIAALIVILLSMSILCVTFIYKRYESNMYSMMSDKIATIQTVLEGRCRYVNNYQELRTVEFTNTLELVGTNTKSDITLFSPDGKVFASTTPEMFERKIIGSRINQDAYYNIKYLNQRYYIHSEKFGDKKYFSLYAPVINENGKLVAIISAPYTTGQNIDFKEESIFYTAIVINLFLILLTTIILLSSAVVNALFKPLIQMSKTMQSAESHGLEYIIYRQDDEISALVDAYNRMVHDLSVSTKNLTQMEKDKAWSEMARQVAHEIKNPLTPIKLEIQRLIRLKQKNDPTWSEKFDKVAAIVLEHIDILTDTANEFSTFAKLYSEEPVVMDLDKTLKEQLTIFDNRDNIRISYMGLADAMVLAPRPQLIRVFVNLITNAIQAVEMNAEGNESEPRLGRILISLRNGVNEGFYEIVFEDNGPGVSEGDQSKLFTPNFTTKSGGTGLGLAICRNIVEKCKGEISYQRSFALGGACFIVRLPKME